MADSISTNFIALSAMIILAACQEDDKAVIPAPFAIAEPSDRAQIQQMLEEGDICNWTDETLHYAAKKEIVLQIDRTIGHSNWGWSCSLDMADNLKLLETPVTWEKPDRDAVFRASLDENGGKDYLSHWPNIIEFWLEGSYPHYETTIGILARHYRFTVSEGVAYTSFGGRYIAFNPPIENRKQTINTTLLRCRVIAEFCVPAFFVSDGNLYPTISRTLP